MAGFAPDVRYLFTAMAVLGFVAAVEFIHQGGHLRLERVRPITFAQAVAMSVAALTPVAGMTLLRWGWTRPAARKWLGVLWDVGTFWPRAFHPFAPPCYAERAVPDLQRRLRWLQDTTGPVLVVAHSQGSILAAAALAELHDDHRPTLITCGSPLTTLYGWAFPAYFDACLLARLAARSRWYNFYYRTDYIGGPVGLPAVDRELPDPATRWYVAGEPLPPIRRHTGYWSDAAMWTAINAGCREPWTHRTAGRRHRREASVLSTVGSGRQFWKIEGQRRSRMKWLFEVRGATHHQPPARR
jgi:hypothetical protein